jgi:hypothetical protein
MTNLMGTLNDVRVIYIFETPFEKRDFERYGIRRLLELNQDIHIWDISPVLSPVLYSKAVEDGRLYPCKTYSSFTDRSAILKNLRNLNGNDLVVCVFGYGYQYRRYWQALSKSNAKIGRMVLGAIPTQDPDPPGNIPHSRFLKVLLRKAGNFLDNPSKGLMKVFRRTPPSLWGIRSFDFLLAGGKRSIENNGLVASNTEIIWLHSLDYEYYLGELEIREPSSATRYILFLDEYYPFHSDYAQSGTPPPCSSEEYYPPLCRFFDQVEKQLGFKIIVAAHPRSEYEKHPDYFGGRQVVKGKTLDLVRNSEFVIAHSSTSLSYAILFKKAVTFVSFSFNRFRNEGALIRAMAAAFNKKVHLIDRAPFELDLKKELAIDLNAYGSYEEFYIKTKSSKPESAWLIFADYVKALSAKT